MNAEGLGCALRSGEFHPELVTSRVADWEEAPQALSGPPRKLVLTRGSA
jgi:hypothetical protein